MLFYPNERLALFIDGPNFYGACKALALDIDYKKLHALFASKGRLVRAGYYTGIVTGEDGFCPITPLIDWLAFNGFAVTTKPVKDVVDAQGARRAKTALDVHIAIDAMDMAEHVDHIVLFSGDGAFIPLVAALQRRGKRVTVASTLNSQPQIISDDLRKQADAFIEIADLASSISKAQVRAAA